MNKQELLLFIERASIEEKEHMLLSLCQDKRVLDVGCVGQNFCYYDEKWLHKKISLVARELQGVDIDREGIEQLKHSGYHIYEARELFANPHEHRYDVIVMADVIEHVDNPVAFLEAYGSLLHEHGSIVVTTPNPFSFRQFLQIFAYKRVSINEEHTMWLDPMTLSEVARRAGLTITNFFWLKDYFKTDQLSPKMQCYYQLANFIGNGFRKFRRYYSASFLCVLQKLT